MILESKRQRVDELILPTPRAESVFFDPKKEITTEEWGLLEMTLTLHLNRGEWSEFGQLAEHMAFMAPDRIAADCNELLTTNTRANLTEAIKQVRRNGMTTLLWDLLAGVKVLDPEGLFKDVIDPQDTNPEKVLSYLKDHRGKRKFVNLRTTLPLISDVCVLRPAILPEVATSLTPKDFQPPWRPVHADNIRYYTAMRLLYPESFSSLGVTEDKLNGFRDELRQPGIDRRIHHDRFAEIGYCLMILSAKAIKITDAGIEIDNSAPDQINQDAPLPTQRNF